MRLGAICVVCHLMQGLVRVIRRDITITAWEDIVIVLCIVDVKEI